IAEVAPDLVDGIIHTDQQPLQVQLKADAQVQVLMELIVMRDERAGRRPTIDRLEDGRLDFEKALVVEEAAHRADALCSNTEDFADVRVYGEIRVALAVALLGVGEAAVALHRAILKPPLFDDGERAEGLGDGAEGLRLDGDLAPARAHHMALDLDKV